MVSIASDVRTRKIITMSSMWGCTYMSLTLMALLYTKKLYNIGNHSCWSLFAFLIFGECIKLTFNNFIINDNVREKQSKLRKVNFITKIKSVVLLISTTVVYYIIAVLFGAPFLSGHEETFMFSLLLTILTTLPSCLCVGADTTASLLIDLTTFEGDIITEIIKQHICLTLFGAWLGALVIPLDWDRPWQVWPIPCCFGSMVGYTCSHLLNIVKLSTNFTKVLNVKTGKYGL